MAPVAQEAGSLYLFSFPGGKCDPADRDVVHTALRETQEELGMAVYVAAVLLGMGCATILVTSLAMTADLIGPHTVGLLSGAKSRLGTGAEPGVLTPPPVSP